MHGNTAHHDCSLGVFKVEQELHTHHTLSHVSIVKAVKGFTTQREMILTETDSSAAVNGLIGLFHSLIEGSFTNFINNADVQAGRRVSVT